MTVSIRSTTSYVGEDLRSGDLMYPSKERTESLLNNVSKDINFRNHVAVVISNSTKERKCFVVFNTEHVFRNHKWVEYYYLEMLFDKVMPL